MNDIILSTVLFRVGKKNTETKRKKTHTHAHGNRFPRIFLVCRDCQVCISGDRDVRIASPVLLLVVLLLLHYFRRKRQKDRGRKRERGDSCVRVPVHVWQAGVRERERDRDSVSD